MTTIRSASAPSPATVPAGRFRRSRKAAVVGLTALIALAPALALPAPAAATPPAATAASPALPATVLVPGREIGLQGTDNTRLLAGYRGADGKTVNDLVLRSDNLSQLTAADQRALQRRGVTAVVDLRTAPERAFQRDRAVPGSDWRAADVLGGVPLLSLVDLPQAYDSFVTDPQARSEIRRTLQVIAQTTARGESVLFHCTAGKDRTGWIAAVLLTVLGVDEATIRADYLASNHYRGASADDPLDGVKPELLDASLAAVAEHYGDFDGYLRDGLGLTSADLDALRGHLLA